MISGLAAAVNGGKKFKLNLLSRVDNMCISMVKWGAVDSGGTPN